MQPESLAPKKAYDIKELAKHLKEQGLELAEDAAEKIAKASFAWLKESAAISENKYDDMAVAVALPKMEEEVFKLVDKIDGHEG